MTAIRKHLRDFLAIIALLVVALIVSVIILANQRCRCRRVSPCSAATSWRSRRS